MSVEVPPPPDGLENSLDWANDSKAKDEERLWPNLEQIRKQDLTNKKWYLVVEGWIVTTFMVLVCLIFAAALVSWSLHFLLPGCAFRSIRPAVPMALAHGFRNIRPNLNAAAERGLLMSAIPALVKVWNGATRVAACATHR